MADDNAIRKIISPTAGLFASEAVWVEGLAVQQLENTGRLPGMLRCVGMPDLNPGKGSPIGAAFLSRLLYPALVGTDIGCGMTFYATELPIRKTKIDKLRGKFDGLDEPYDGPVDDLLQSCRRLNLNS